MSPSAIWSFATTIAVGPSGARTAAAIAGAAAAPDAADQSPRQMPTPTSPDSATARS